LEEELSIIDQALVSPNRTKAIISIDEYLSSRFYTDPSSLTEYEKDIVYIESLEREVNNGGFDQFFFNSSGDTAHETVAALERIGARATAEILKQAIGAFPHGVAPKSREARQDLMEAIEDDAEALWHELDDRFYAYEDDIGALVLDYIRKNRHQFK
jgi:hypothetical protein